MWKIPSHFKTYIIPETQIINKSRVTTGHEVRRELLSLYVIAIIRAKLICTFENAKPAPEGSTLAPGVYKGVNKIGFLDDKTSIDIEPTIIMYRKCVLYDAAKCWDVEFVV